MRPENNGAQGQEVSKLRTLITGIGGFAGSHLAEHLLSLGGVEVHGVLSPRGSADNLTAVAEAVTLYRVDLIAYDDVYALLDHAQPDLVYHLAARASVSAAWKHPKETLDNNITAQLNVLRGLAESGARPRVLVVASADEYGRVQPDELPVDEETPLRPVNPYAVSKIAQDYLGLQYHLSHGLPVVRVRPFNHSGPRQETGFVIPDFCSQIARIEADLQPPVLRVGNLAAERDFSDVRDIVRGYHLALMRGEDGEVYNVGAGQAYAIQEILDRLLAQSRVAIEVEPDPEHMRPSDVPCIVSDCTKLEQTTGWKPKYPLEETLSDTLNYWRRRISG